MSVTAEEGVDKIKHKELRTNEYQRKRMRMHLLPVLKFKVALQRCLPVSPTERREREWECGSTEVSLTLFLSRVFPFICLSLYVWVYMWVIGILFLCGNYNTFSNLFLCTYSDE